MESINIAVAWQQKQHCQLKHCFLWAKPILSFPLSILNRPKMFPYQRLHHIIIRWVGVHNGCIEWGPHLGPRLGDGTLRMNKPFIIQLSTFEFQLVMKIKMTEKPYITRSFWNWSPVSASLPKCLFQNNGIFSGR